MIFDKQATLGLSSFLIILLGCGSAQVIPSQDPCAEPSGGAASVWNAEVRNDLNLSVRILNGEIEAAEAELVTDRLNQFTTDWEILRDATCRDHHEHQAITPAEHDVVMACLDTALEDFRAVVDALKAGDKAIGEELETLHTVLDQCRGDGSIYRDRI